MFCVYLYVLFKGKTVGNDANLEIDENDPFGAAPIHQHQMRLVLL